MQHAALTAIRVPVPRAQALADSRRLPRAASLSIVADANDDYLAREAKARKNIDRQLAAAGWIVQHTDQANVTAGPGVAVREFGLQKGHGRVDYLLFTDGQ